MALFGRKSLRIEVVDGIDIESGVTLTGDRATVGTGDDDTLRLGEADVLPAQVTFQRKGAAWEYFVSDRGQTDVRGGHARAGRLRAGQEFRLGKSARLSVRRVAAPAAVAADAADVGAPPQVPIALALPVLGLIVVGAFAVATQMRDTAPPAPLLATTRWFTQAEPLGPALDACLDAAADMPADRVARSAPDWAFREWLRAGDKSAPEALAARDALLDGLRDAIARAHVLHDARDNAGAAALFRRLENAIPVGNRACPILAATRRDLAVLELTGNGN